MEHDKLKLFNTKLAMKIVEMDDERLWNFLLENGERIKYLTNRDVKPRVYPASGFLYAYPHGIEWFKKHFLEHIENYREGVVYTVIIDFCFQDEHVYLEYWSRCGYLDNEDSCGVKTSDEIMPPVDEDTEEGSEKQYFHLLEPVHLDGIIRAMEENFDKLEKNTRKDIAKIKKMRKFCLKNEDWNVVYIYDV